MRTLLEVLRLSAEYLKERGLENPRREAEWLLCNALGLQRLQIYLEHDRPLLDAEVAKCRQWLKRRGAREPLQYISGEMEFYGCRLSVDPRALIPRQETELLVDHAVKRLATHELAGKVVWDLCTGSGCIAVAIKRRFPEVSVIGSDISSEALSLAAHNAERNAVAVTWIQGDFLAPLAERGAIDYCFCNPPYLTHSELLQLEPEVGVYEPRQALDGGVDGLDFYRRLASALPPHLNSGAHIWLEIGAGQGAAVSALFSGAPWLSCHLHKDLAGHDRFIFLVRE